LIGYNTTILDFVISKIKQISTNEEELKLTNRNVQIESSRIYDKIDLPSQKDIDKIDVIEDEIEERLVSENEIIKVDNIFSLEVDSNFKALTKGIKLIRYIEIISKAFPDFHHKMNKVERKEQVESMFRVPNIISYIAYNDVREKLNNLKEEIYTELRNENPKSKMKVLYDNLESEINRFLAFLYNNNI
jgi:predicted Co/Zn/Cd cation transporter (cation efflux family)